MKAADPIQYTGVNPVDPNTLAQHLAPNYEGTPTQFYDAQGNLKGVLVDTVRAGLGAKEGSLILDPASLGLALKPGETPSLDSAVQQRNEQGQMLFVDPTTGGTTIYNTGVPALSGSTVKDLMYINDPGKRGGQIPADTMQAALIAAAIATGGALAPELLGADVAATAALTDAGLSASQIAALGAEYGTGSAAAVGAGAGTGALTDVAATNLMSSGLLPAEMQIPASGVNWGAAATQAAKTAAINAAVTAAQGGSPTDILKAGALGAVTGGAGAAGADLLGGGTLAQIGTQTAVATATAAATGKDPVQAALSGALTATLANVVPANTSDILNGAGITDPSIQKAVNSAISSSIITAIKGGNVSTAALMGAVNSGLGSVAGMIGNSQIVQDIKASINDTISSTVDSINYATGITNAQALPVEGSNKAIAGTPLDTATQPDVVNSVFQQDAQDVMNRNVPPPLVQNAIDQNTPKTVDNVVTPPLIQQAVNQSDAERMAQALRGFQQNPTVGAPLSTLVSATTSDAPITLPTVMVLPYAENTYITYKDANGIMASSPVSTLLDQYREEPGNEDAQINDPTFQKYVAGLEATSNTSNTNINPDAQQGVNTSASLNNIARLTPEQAMSAGIPEGIYKIIVGGAAPQNSVIGSSAASVPIPSNAAGIYNQILNLYGNTDATAFVIDNPDLTKNALIDLGQKGGLPYDKVQAIADAFVNNPNDVAAFKMQVANIINIDPSNPVFDAQSTPPLTPAPTPDTATTAPKPPLTPTASAPTPSQGNNQTAGGGGTGGAAAAGNEGAPGAVSSAGAASLTQARNIVSQAASSNEIPAEDIPIDAQRLMSNADALGTSPAQAVSSGLVNPDGSLTAKGIKQISDATGLSPSDVVALTNASTTARTGTGSGITSTGAGATTGAATGAATSGTGIGGSAGTNIGGLGTGTGTGVGPGAGTGSGDGSGDGLGLGLGSGSGSGTSGAGTGGVKAAVAPAAVVQPSYSYSGAGTQGTTVGALPGNLQATFLQGVNVNEYNPFENYDKYQQLAPIHAKDGGSPLQLAQLQQGIAGVDPSLYNVLQKRAAPSYFTYGQDTSGGNPTTFAGSQLLGKPTPNIPVIPTGQKSGSDWLYQGSGTNPLAMAGTGIPSLGAGTMAQGGQAHGGEGEHIPEFITGATGHYVKGGGDGQSDSIKAMLADGEYVLDSSAVSTLGNGSSDAGAKLLDAFRESLREHTRSAPADKIPPKASPLMYMQEAMKKVGMK
jgi:hypothetical protein